MIIPKVKWIDLKPDSHKKTGGSTGDTLHFGQLLSEEVDGSANMWIGRMAYGHGPSMKCFILWGHEHLLGVGMSRYVNVALRRLKDQVMNFYRVSSYDYAVGKLRSDFDKMLDFAPTRSIVILLRL